MNFNFQQMKPVIQKEFDEVLALYPTDMTELRERIPRGADAYERKRAILENAAREREVKELRRKERRREKTLGKGIAR